MKKKTYTLQSAEPYHDENDIVGWWMDVLAVQGEFVERLFGGGVRSCGDDGDPVLIGADMNAGVD